MEKIEVIFQTTNNEILFKEFNNVFNLPRVGENIIYGKQYLKVNAIWHNFDEKRIEIDVELF